MRFAVLGPLQVTREGGEPVPMLGPKERTVLAYLVARANRGVSVDELIDELWGDNPPRTAEKTLGVYVSRLRGRLRAGDGVAITWRAGGYTLDGDGAEIDAQRFEHLAGEGHRLLQARRLREARGALDEALALWRGAAYEGFSYTAFGAAEGDRLDELRRAAEEDRVDAYVQAGDHAVIADLQTMVRDAPLRERRWGQLMVALYRDGQQGEALRAFRRARSVLIEELGIEPGPDLQRLHAGILSHDPDLERPQPSVADEERPDVCPYKGLARFEIADAEYFFGREQLVSEAIGRLIEGSFLAFVGASGSGKSSLLRAGVLHALLGGAAPGSDRWTLALMRPGEHPIQALADAIGRARAAVGGAQRTEGSLESIARGSGADGRFVLAIDQFEETFSACSDADERTAFLDEVTSAALWPESRVTLLMAMRSDHYGRCAEHRQLAWLVATSQVLVGPMGEDELRRAITLPAAHVDLEVDDALVDALLEDVSDRSGGLPLLSTALLELWTRRRDQALRLDDYLTAGRVDGAIARLAESAFGRLDRSAQEAAHRILMRLADVGGDAPAVARRADTAEFDLHRDAVASRAMAALTDARLVTVSEGSVEVAHEALLREWPRLRAWLDEDSAGLRLHRSLTASAHGWNESGRDDADLYRGARLAGALDWSRDHGADLNELERDFLDRSRAAAESETVTTRRANRLLRSSLAGVACLLVLSLVVGGLALVQRDRARESADVADARRLAATSLLTEELDAAALLAREAVRIHDAPETRSALLAALLRAPGVLATMHAPPHVAGGGDARWIESSPDGRFLAIGGDGRGVAVFDAHTHQLVADVDVGAATTAGAFSLDGATLAVASASRGIVVVDVATETVRSVVPSGDTIISDIVYSPDAGLVVTIESSENGSFLVPRGASTFEPVAARVRDVGAQTSVAFSGDGRVLVTTSVNPAETVVWDAHAFERLRRFPVPGADLAVRPHGEMAALISNTFTPDGVEGRLTLIDLTSGRVRAEGVGHVGPSETEGGATGVAFTSDGRSVVTTGNDSTAVVWSVAAAEPQGELGGATDLPLLGPALLPDGATVYTTNTLGTVTEWDLTAERGMRRTFVAGSGLDGWPLFALSSDGATLAVPQAAHVAASHGAVELIDVSSLSPIGEIPYPHGVPQGLAFAPDDGTLAVGSWNDAGREGVVELWDPDSMEPVGRPFPGIAPQEDPWAVSFSPGGGRLAAATRDLSALGAGGRVLVWDLATRELVGEPLELEDPVNQVRFLADGTLLAVTGLARRGDLVFWDLADGSVRSVRADPIGVWWSDVSADGRLLATAGQTSSVALWDAASGEALSPRFNGLTGPAITVDLGADRLLASSNTGQVLMWDVHSGTQVGTSLPGPQPDEWVAATFTPDDRHVIVVSETGAGWIWELDPSTWMARACLVAGRNLTGAEWQTHVPGRPYSATCHLEPT